MEQLETKEEETEPSVRGELEESFFDCFVDENLKRAKVKKMKGLLSTISPGVGDIAQVKLLESNGNIKSLHSCLHNELGLLFYLLLEEGYNLTDCSKAISSTTKGNAAARTSIQYWADKYAKELKIISRDLLAKGRGTYYQKDDKYSYLHGLIEEAAKKVLAARKKKELRGSIPKPILDKLK